jgi:hypothetical protein
MSFFIVQASENYTAITVKQNKKLGIIFRSNYSISSYGKKKHQQFGSALQNKRNLPILVCVELFPLANLLTFAG